MKITEYLNEGDTFKPEKCYAAMRMWMYDEGEDYIDYHELYCDFYDVGKYFIAKDWLKEDAFNGIINEYNERGWKPIVQDIYTLNEDEWDIFYARFAEYISTHPNEHEFLKESMGDYSYDEDYDVEDFKELENEYFEKIKL